MVICDKETRNIFAIALASLLLPFLPREEINCAICDLRTKNRFLMCTGCHYGAVVWELTGRERKEVLINRCVVNIPSSDTLARFFSLTSPAFTTSHPPEGHSAFLPRHHATTRGTTPPSITQSGAWQSSRDKSRQLHLPE